MTELGFGFVFGIVVLVEVFGLSIRPTGVGAGLDGQIRHFCGLRGFVMRKQWEGGKSKEILRKLEEFKTPESRGQIQEQALQLKSFTVSIMRSLISDPKAVNMMKENGLGM